MQPINTKPTKFMELSKLAIEKEHKVRLNPNASFQVYCFPKTICEKRYNQFTSTVMFVCTTHNNLILRIDYEKLPQYNLRFITFPGKINRINNETISFYNDYFRIVIKPPQGLNKYISYSAGKVNEPDQYIQKFVNPFMIDEEEVPDDILNVIDYA